MTALFFTPATKDYRRGMTNLPVLVTDPGLPAILDRAGPSARDDRRAEKVKRNIVERIFV